MSHFALMSKAELVRAMEQLEPVLVARDELAATVQDLQRHQIELEMQNRALREAQQALEQSHHRYVDLYDFAPVAYLTLDARACIQEVNLTAAELLNQDRPRLVGQPFVPFVESADTGRFLQHVRRCVAEGGVGSLELKLRIAGRRAEVRLHTAPFPSGAPQGGQVCRVAMVDITELRETQARLALAERLASLGTLAAGVAHELNNPLAFIAQCLELARLRVGEGVVGAARSEVQNLLVDAAVGTEQLRTIVRDLHTFARAEEEHREHVDVREVLGRSIRMAHGEIRHRAKLVRDEASVSPVLANEGRLGQVFLNLLVNAARAIPEGRADQHEVRVVTRNEGSWVVVEVSDTGQGIPPERLGRIFDPFFTTQPEGQGLGLGLSISQSLVTRMGGELSVESELGRGSLFRVRIPAAPAGSSSGALLPVRRSPRKPTRRGRILIVDDEPKLALTLGMLLEEEHNVTRTLQAREALELIHAGPLFDAILCDLMMPEMTGEQLFEAVLAAHPEQARRMIFMTGGAFTPGARHFLEHVKNPRLIKPFRVDELEATLALMVG
ncbi:hybrid sensor histidine kinase/response regulator [Pyxidicoccus caerfyrddinensis]|uniref:hybrid sensor histidine kinase/response regulator n=1 Tax=Pyxidicoccus caerfyrddinensis TaxID=2709663 RepID=UPI0013DA05B6|nr:ATP-binding protein [Pyxidicoccus caerfyrddinensis]